MLDSRFLWYLPADGEGTHDVVTLLETLDAAADFVDVANELVSHDKVEGRGLVSTVYVQIRAAEGRELDLYDDVGRVSWLWDGSLLDCDLVRSLDDNSFHCLSRHFVSRGEG